MGRTMRARGLTLIELVVALAVLALLATLALPSFGALVGRHRLVTTAESLALDLAEARFQAAQLGSALHVVFRAGDDWCWAVARAPGCDCAPPRQACVIKAVAAGDNGGVRLSAATDASFGPAGEAVGGRAVLHSADGREELRVQLTALGRARICAVGGLRGYTAC